MSEEEIKKQLLEEFKGYSQAPMIIERTLELQEKEFKKKIEELKEKLSGVFLRHRTDDFIEEVFDELNSEGKEK